jgi:hypothetical protein
MGVLTLGPGVVAAVTALLTGPIPGWVSHLGVQSLPNPSPNLVVFVSDANYMANGYQGLLTDEGFDVAVLTPDYIDDVTKKHPGLVIFGSNPSQNETVSLSEHPAVLEYLRQKAKVVGMGTEGGLIFDQIGESPLSLGQMKGLPSSQVLLSDSLTLPGLDARVPVQVYTGADAEQQAVPALGSHVLSSRNAIGQPPGEADACGSYWSIVQYRNLLFWGFTSPEYNLTDAGRRIFVSLIKEMASIGIPRFEEPPKDKPGNHPDQMLDCNSLQDRHHFDVQPWDTVTVTVTGTSGSPLVTRLTDPTGTPVELGKSQPGMTAGVDWQLTVTTDGRVATSGATYDYRIDESFNWVVLLLALAVILVPSAVLTGLIFLIARSIRTRHRPPNSPPTQPGAAKPEPQAEVVTPADDVS